MAFLYVYVVGFVLAAIGFSARYISQIRPPADDVDRAGAGFLAPPPPEPVRPSPMIGETCGS